MLNKNEIERNFSAFSDFYHDSMKVVGSDNGSKSLLALAYIKYSTENSHANFEKNVELQFGFNDPQEYQFVNLEGIDSKKYYTGFSTKWQHFKYDKVSKTLIIKGIDSISKGIGNYTVEIYNVAKR